MAKKKPDKKTPSKSSPLADRRAMEKSMMDIQKLLQGRDFESIEEVNKFLKEALSKGMPVEEAAPDSSLEEAQDIMVQAWEATGARRVKLARKALEVCPDCADAYVLLAEEVAQTPAEARAFYEQGVKAGERALGPDARKELKGHYWGVLETRPYMRARFGLAQCLWEMGELREAADHMSALLKLNPDDNQGVRYSLLTLLMELGDNDAALKLHRKYKDDAMAVWRYNGALLTFRLEGPSEKAAQELKDAISYNPLVPPYLLGTKNLPKYLPAYIGFGDENEAVAYTAENDQVWIESKGALEWLKKAWSAFNE